MTYNTVVGEHNTKDTYLMKGGYLWVVVETGAMLVVQEEVIILVIAVPIMLLLE